MKQDKTATLLDSLRPMIKPSMVLVAILALTFYLRLLYFGQYIDADVGNAGYQAWRMAMGEVVMDIEGPGKPPLYPMLYALFIRFFGPSVLGLKMFGAIFVLLAAVAVYWVANKAYGKKVGLLAAFLFGVFSSGPMVEGGTVNLETVMHLPSVLAIGLFLKASLCGRRRWYFLAGVSAALAMLVKQVSGVLFFVFLCYWIHEWWKQKDSISRMRSLYRYGVLCAGALLPVIALICFYHYHGYTLFQLYDAMLGSNLRYIQRGYAYPSLPRLLATLKVMFPENGLLWLGTMFTAVYAGRKIWRGEGEARDRILLGWVIWSFVAVWISGNFYYHYFLQLIAPFSVLTAYGIVRSWRLAESLSPLSRRVAKGGWAIILVVLTIIVVKTDYKYFFSYTPVEQTAFHLKISSDVFDPYGIRNIVYQQIAWYMSDHTDPIETIYVWGIAPQIYFLAQRKAATRYRNNYNMSPNVTGDPVKALKTYAAEVMEDMRRSPPAYIVQIFPLEWFPELQGFVLDRYALDRSIEPPVPISPDRFDLYRRRVDDEVVATPR